MYVACELQVKAAELVDERVVKSRSMSEFKLMIRGDIRTTSTSMNLGIWVAKMFIVNVSRKMTSSRWKWTGRFARVSRTRDVE